MSGVIDCMVRVAGASIDLAKEIGMGSVDMVKEFTGGFVKGIGDISNSLKNLARDEKEMYKNTLKKYEESLANDKEKENNYISKIVNDERVKSLNVINSPSNKEEANKLFMCAVLMNKCKLALDELEADTDEYYELEKLKETIKNSFNKLDFVNDVLEKKINELKTRLQEIMNVKNNYDVQKVNEVYMELSSDISEAYVTVFNNELMELLKNTSDRSLEKKNLLLELKRKMIDYALKLNNLEYVDGVEECQNMIEFVNSTLNDDSISDDLKIERINIRVNALKDNYLKCELNNKKIFDLKEKFDKAYWLNVSYKKYLNREIKEKNFDFKNLSEEIQILEKENKELYVECEKKQKNEYIRKAIREAMISNELEYVSSKSSNNGRSHIDQDVYHIENGDVVTVTISESGAMNYVVGNANIDGIYSDESQTLESMKKFCDKYKDIQNKLKEKGIIVDEIRRLEPNVKYIHNVNLDDGPKEIIRNKIKKAKDVKHSELKRKHLGDE